MLPKPKSSSGLGETGETTAPHESSGQQAARTRGMGDKFAKAALLLLALSLFNVVSLQGSFSGHSLWESTYDYPSKETARGTNIEEHPPQPSWPHVQVAVATSPSQGKYWERYYANSNGWHRQFPDLMTFTFDRVEEDSQLSKLVANMHLLPGEAHGYRSNVQLTALAHTFHLNPNSTWYLVVDDDTIVVKRNLDTMIAQLERRGDVNTTEYYIGKCVYYDADFGRVWFAVGGAGILMNRKTLEQLAPKVKECRRQYAESVFYGDGRIGACLQYTLNLYDHYKKTKCGPDGYTFTNNPVQKVFLNHPPNNLAVTLHEKNITNSERVNDAILELSRDESQNITWQVLYEYLVGSSKGGGSNNGTTLLVGDRVIADWKLSGDYYSGVVTNLSQSTNTVTVKYDDDNTSETLPIHAVFDRNHSFL